MREVVVVRRPGETRIAAAENGRIIDLGVFRDGAARRGAVFQGRVTGATPDDQAVFVDLGLDRAGFLPIKGDCPTEGTAVLVQITREAHGEKGPELTTKPSFQGRFLVYTPSRPGVAVSKAIYDKGHRRRLQELVEALKDKGEGLIVRSAAEGASRAVLEEELAGLRAAWATARKGDYPGPDPLRAFLNGEEERIAFNDRGLMTEAKALYPDLAERMGTALESLTPADLDETLEGLLEAQVPLFCGGRLSIETTRALTAIDVDSGGAKARLANVEAVNEIARQLRLRNIGGQIVVDFISEANPKMLRALTEVLRQAVLEDSVPTHVMGVTNMGLVELTRERRSPPLSDLFLGRSVSPLNDEAAALAALNAVLAEAQASKSTTISLTARGGIVRALKGPLGQALRETEAALGHKLPLKADEGLAGDGYKIA